MNNGLVKSAFETSWRSTALIATNLAVARGDTVLCSHVSFSVSNGQILHVQGQNGVGKTTLLMILAGLLPVSDDGRRYKQTLVWANLPASEWPVLYIGHLAGLNAGLSVRENLEFLQGLNTGSMEQFSVALDHVGLSGYEDITLSRLSSGQKRRVSLARLWLRHDADVLWLLDEPFNSLDARMTMKLSERLAEHAERGGRVILTSHQALTIPVQILDLDEFVLPLSDGGLESENSPDEYQICERSD